MATTVTLSLRVAPELREQLQREAAEHRTSMSAIAVGLIRAGLEGGAPTADGPLVEAVTVLFADVTGEGTDVEREMALQLARTAQSGGTAGVSAVRELRSLAAGLLAEEDVDDWAADLSVPE